MQTERESETDRGGVGVHSKYLNNSVLVSIHNFYPLNLWFVSINLTISLMISSFDFPIKAIPLTSSSSSPSFMAPAKTYYILRAAVAYKQNYRGIWSVYI